MSAIAVYELLAENYNLKPDIKWANDVLIGDKKICGILAEMCETAKGTAIIVGIGINLTSSNFPKELGEIATSIEAETKEKQDAEVLLENLTKQFSKFYKILSETDGAEKIRAEWTRRSSYAFGKKVKVHLENETFSGETCGIEENGALRVKSEDGEIKVIQAGDVEKLRASD